MAANFLFDTGAILAILNEKDTWHAVCTETFHRLPFPGLTSEAVLTEVFHLVNRSRTEMESVWGFIDSGVVAVATIANSELPQVHSLMTRYRDRPMDFADATLVYLAGRESLNVVFTVDHADFATYRMKGNRRFQILPLERP